MVKIDPKLQEKLATLLASMGYEFAGGELLRQGGQTIFRLFIDRPQGVTIDDCAKVSRQVSALLDVEDPISGRYSLEVSSPGIDRRLFDIKDYKRFVGNRIKLTLRLPINERRHYKGRLQRVEGEDIYLLVEVNGKEAEIIVPFSLIEKANLIGII